MVTTRSAAIKTNAQKCALSAKGRKITSTPSVKTELLAPPHESHATEETKPKKRRNYSPGTCLTCHKTFSRQHDVKRHEKVHTTEGEFLCQYCGKAHRQRSACKIHERRHTGDKPAVCPSCDMCYRDPSALLRHRKAQHKYEPRPRASTKKMEAIPTPQVAAEATFESAFDSDAATSELSSLRSTPEFSSRSSTPRISSQALTPEAPTVLFTAELPAHPPVRQVSTLEHPRPRPSPPAIEDAYLLLFFHNPIWSTPNPFLGQSHLCPESWPAQNYPLMCPPMTYTHPATSRPGYAHSLSILNIRGSSSSRLEWNRGSFTGRDLLYRPMDEFIPTW